LHKYIGKTQIAVLFKNCNAIIELEIMLQISLMRRQK